MKILVAHNRYQQSGGEDAVVAAEIRLLESRGHEVVRYERHNDELKGRGTLSTLAAGTETLWATTSVRDIRGLIARERPDVAHFHNTFPLISPAAYHACAESGVPVVQTLHNYRLLCPAATLLREGKVCEECLGRSVAWPAVVHGCYRESRPITAASAAMLAVHRLMGTWRNKVDAYVALSEFARRKFIDGGLPPDRIAVKPNFVEPDPGLKQGAGEYALFVGRLAEEKGLRVLLAAWSLLHSKIPLRIAGDGPLRNEIAGYISASKLPESAFVGQLTSDEIVRAMHNARFLIFPSIWFEAFPVTIAQAFACALPVIASRLGSLTEIVLEGSTGLQFVAGHADDLAAKMEWAWAHPAEMQAMGRQARAQFDAKYTAERNYEQFVGLWRRLRIDVSLEGKRCLRTGTSGN